MRSEVASNAVVTAALEKLGAWAADPTSYPKELFNPSQVGRPIGRQPIHGKRYVVFSDHHLGPSRHRANVFNGVGGRHFSYSNHGLYVAVLEYPGSLRRQRAA